MPIFVVEVKDSRGNLEKKKVEAISAEQARSILQNKYPLVVNVKKAGFNFDMSEISANLASVSVKDKALFSRQFSAMIDAGVALVRCLGILSDQCDNPKLKRALMDINGSVQEGNSLSESMAKHPSCFDQLYVSMVEAGEVGGILDEVLGRLATLLEDMAKLQAQIKSAMTYPMAVGTLAVIVFFAMTIFLVPIFAGIFEGLGTQLPLLTRFMLWTSKLLRSWKVVIPFVGIIAFVFVYKQYYKTPMGRLQIDGLMLKLPLMGDLNSKNAVARFCRIFGTLTRSGVPILTSMEIVEQTAGNVVISNAIAAASEEIQQGGMMSVALEKSQVFPALAIQMISIGEETGQIDAMMMKVADFYENEVEQAVKALTSLLEPLMMCAVAGLVGVILLSMYLPMFKVFNELG
jgi:type IV pilus assembly protein PilC